MKNILNSKKIIMTITILSKVLRRKMNSIPEDVVEHIISFSCDKRGYNTIDYYQRIKNNEDRMKRILIELSDFFFYMKVKNRPFSLRSLKPTICQKWKYKMFKENLKEGNPTILYHTGLFLNFEDMLHFLLRCLLKDYLRVKNFHSVKLQFYYLKFQFYSE